MTKRDRSAERRVAEFLSQNSPAPKMEQAPADDLFTAAEKDKTSARMFFESVKGLPCANCNKPLAMRNGEEVFVIGTDLACSQECADTIAEAYERPVIGSLKTPDVFDSPFKRSRLPEKFIDIASTAPDSETSARAADTIGPTQRPKAYLVYQHIKACGKTGATRQEIADALAISLQSVCSLVRRLYEMGWVGSNPGDVRLNRLSGLENEVMLHEDHVIRWQPNQARPPIRAKWMTES